MKIQICETTIATKDVNGLKKFYARLLGEGSSFEDHNFFFTVRDKETAGQVSLVPHNGEKKWDQPWICLKTDDLNAAIEHLKNNGVLETDIEPFGTTDEQGKPVEGVTFKDPDGRTTMLMRTLESFNNAQKSD